MTDSELLDALERYVTENGPLVLYAGSQYTSERRGLLFASDLVGNRTFRMALDHLLGPMVSKEPEPPKKTGKMFHLSMDLRGFIRNNQYPSAYREVFVRADGTRMFASEAREFLLDCIAKGWNVIPTEKCEGFDYQTGCPGHRIEEEVEP